MALNFPSAPNVNATYTFSDKTWTYNGNAWVLSYGTLNTGVVSEGSNLYFSNARVYSNVTQLGYITSSSLSGYATNAQLTSYATTANSLSQFASTTSAQLATLISNETGTGNLVFATSPTLVTPILGTPTSATLTNATGLPLTTGVTGTLPIANGGTNSTATATAGGIGYGTGTAHAYTSAGTNGQVLTSAGASAPTWASPSSGALVYISQVVASGSATVSFTGLTAYDNYMVIFSKVFPDTTSVTYFTMLTSTNNGSSYATTDYKYSVIYGNQSNGTANGRYSGENNTYINLTGSNMDADVASSQISGQIVLNLKNGTSYDFFAWGNFAQINDNPAFLGGTFSSNRTETSATDAVRFKFTSGNMVTGTFRLYGIVNS